MRKIIILTLLLVSFCAIAHPASGDKLWEFATGGYLRSNPAIDSDGIIYVGGQDTSLYALNPDGTQRWTYTDTGYLTTAVLADDGTVYVGSWTSKIVALDPVDGTTKWTYGTNTSVSAAPAVGPGGVVYVADYSGMVYALNPTGSPIWSYNVGSTVVSSPAVGSDGTIYFGACDQKLYALNSNGTVKWTYVTGDDIYGQSAIDVDGTIYFGSNDGKLYALNSDGTLKWFFSTGGSIDCSPAIGPDGVIYFGSHDNNLYALYPDGSAKWSFATAGPIFSSPSVGDDGNIYFGSTDNKIYGLDPNGAELWEYATGGIIRNSSPAIVSGVLYIGSFDYKLYAIEISSTGLADTPWPKCGRNESNTAFFTEDIQVTNPGAGDEVKLESRITIAWSDSSSDNVKIELYKGDAFAAEIAALTENDGEYSWYVPGSLAEGENYSIKVSSLEISWLNDSSDVFSVVPLQAGDKKWDFLTGNYVHSSPAIGSDGTVYVASCDSKLYAIDPDGSKQWEFLTGSAVYCSPAIGSDGTIYVGSYDKKLYAINPDGTKKWDFLTGDIIFGSPAVGCDGTVYQGSADGKLYAINTDGTKKWEYQTASQIYWPAPAVGGDGTVYIGTAGGSVYAIDADGNRRWEFVTGSTVYSSPAIGSDGTIYVGSYDGKLYAINPDGSKKWDFLTGSAVYCSPAIGSDGTIYVGSFDHNLYALNPDGTQKWVFLTNGAIYSSPVAGSDGIIYIASGDGKIYAIDPDGSKQWEFQTGGAIYSVPNIANDGTIYVGSYDYMLYAIKSSSLGLGNTPWPRRGRDGKNTGSIQMMTPANLSLDYVEGTGVATLTWTDDSLLETGYEIECSTDGETYTKMGETASDVMTYQFNQTEPCENSYRVRAVYSFGLSEYSNVVDLDVSGVYGYLVPNDVIWGRCKVYVRTAGPALTESDLHITVDSGVTQYAMEAIDGGFQSGAVFNGLTFANTASTVKIWLDGELYDTMDITEGDLYSGAQLSFDGMSFTSSSNGGRAMLYETEPGLEKPENTVRSFSVRFDGEGVLNIENPLGQSGALLHYEDGEWVCVSYAKESLVFDKDGDYVLVNDTAGNFIPRITDSALKQNYPNPFNPETDIDFELEEGGYVRIEVYDSRGRKIRTLAQGAYMPGIHSVHWDGRDSRGGDCASGVYYCRLTVNGKAYTRKMVMLK